MGPLTAGSAAHAHRAGIDDGFDERAAIARAVAGDASAFASLIRRHNRRLYRLARATLRNDAEAEDALQDAYVLAFRSLHAFRGDAALSTWLSRLVLNACHARQRRDARREHLAPVVNEGDGMDALPDHAEGPDRAAMRGEMRVLLERALDALPRDFRIVFVLRSVEDMSAEEVASCLGVPEATVRSRHFRARAMLREVLARETDLAERELYEFGGARCDRVVAAVLKRLGDPGDA